MTGKRHLVRASVLVAVLLGLIGPPLFVQAADTKKIKAAYQRRFAAHLATVRQLALADGCDYRRVSTAVPYLQILVSFLVERTG